MRKLFLLAAGFALTLAACQKDEGLVPELDAQALVQGVIMSEILKRPNERKWGWR